MGEFWCYISNAWLLLYLQYAIRMDIHHILNYPLCFLKLSTFYEESTSINKATSLNSHEMVAEKRKSTQKQKYNKLYKGVFQCSRAYGLKIFF